MKAIQQKGVVTKGAQRNQEISIGNLTVNNTRPSSGFKGLPLWPLIIMFPKCSLSSHKMVPQFNTKLITIVKVEISSKCIHSYFKSLEELNILCSCKEAVHIFALSTVKLCIDHLSRAFAPYFHLIVCKKAFNHFLLKPPIKKRWTKIKQAC